MPDLKFGIPIPPPLTTEKGRVSIGATGTELVERTRNLYVPSINPFGRVPLIAGT